MAKTRAKKPAKDNTYRLSVLDTLLNRNAADSEPAEQPREALSDPDTASRHVSPPSSQKLSENAATNSTLESPLFRETRTPTTRAEQLPILLARNYYTAPACLLRFINTSSSIRSYVPSKRDSDGTVIDEFDPLIDCNVETNDEMDDFALEQDGPETFSVGTMTARTSLIDRQFRDPEDLPYVAVDPGDPSPAVKSVEPRCAQRFDKACSPFAPSGSSRQTPVPKATMDVGTSPFVFPESEARPKRASTTRLEPAQEPEPAPEHDQAPEPELEPEPQAALEPEPTELESLSPVTDAVDLSTTNVDCDADFEVPPQSACLASPKADDCPTLKAGDFSARSAELSSKRRIPVYCRSLLYRIRVPLSKRLKNIDEDVLANSMSSPLLSASRVNLSCDRVYALRSRHARSADRTDSVLRLSDLGSNSGQTLSPPLAAAPAGRPRRSSARLKGRRSSSSNDERPRSAAAKRPRAVRAAR